MTDAPDNVRRMSFPETQMNVAILLSCGSFEGFFGSYLGQTRQSYLERYRSDWSWYYARGLLNNGINPVLYIPALYEKGRYQTDANVSVRFLPMDIWYRPFERRWLKRLSRSTRWSLYAEEYINTIAFMRSLRASLDEDDIQVLYVQEYWSARFDLIARSVTLPVVAADHGGVAKGVVKWFKQRAFKKAVVCYAQTVDECRIVEECGGRALHLANGCDVSEFFPDPSLPRSKTVLTVTRLTNKQKRTSDLIRAMAELPEEWSLDVVGTGPDKPMLEGLAASLGISGRVRFHGFVGRSDVRDFYRRCGVYAMPSANEGLAVAALEAMACSAAVVLSKIRAFEQLVVDGVNGRLVPVGDVHALAAGIQDAWQNRASFGEAARETIRTHYNTQVTYSTLAKSLRDAAR
jgi:glycosyltransferase involved in cell wall biosynthesis